MAGLRRAADGIQVAFRRLIIGLLTHTITRAVISKAARGVCRWRATIERLIAGEAISIIVAKRFVADTITIGC